MLRARLRRIDFRILFTQHVVLGYFQSCRAALAVSGPIERAMLLKEALRSR